MAEVEVWLISTNHSTNSCTVRKTLVNSWRPVTFFAIATRKNPEKVRRSTTRKRMWSTDESNLWTRVCLARKYERICTSTLNLLRHQMMSRLLEMWTGNNLFRMTTYNFVNCCPKFMGPTRQSLCITWCDFSNEYFSLTKCQINNRYRLYHSFIFDIKWWE